MQPTNINSILQPEQPESIDSSANMESQKWQDYDVLQAKQDGEHNKIRRRIKPKWVYYTMLCA